ncbi:zinc finger CCHC domain-containing protein 4-like [Centruroides sculpturatus]|uniref:zinc finger CCHC domain-containing protein 4-like n=1 Tax=Centruroides sculpturatus TaxID=218467 RepID=UPI000C6D8E94|nr:zinc finger CCHC domain-containing protein 4-like [Centruroides sculpturatus]
MILDIRMTSLGVDLVIQEDISSNPRCSHGPTLLFTKFVKDARKTGRRFYACSACRDRKECQFFQWEDEKMSSCRKNHWENELKKTQNKLSHKQCIKRMKQILKLQESERRFCKTCFCFVLPNEQKAHGQHVVCCVKQEELRKPSNFVLPVINNKKEAQFFFSENTVKFLIESIELLGYERCLCIGTPRIHEHIHSKCESSLKSLLLDLDERYKIFYNQETFCHYNMFNNYFFDGEESEKIFYDYLNDDKIVVLLDPPFGGHVDALMQTYKTISRKWTSITGVKTELPILLFNPYFMEPRLTEAMPSLVMMDYKVQYINHSSFHNNQKGRKFGSPVRIFTNIEAKYFKLPDDDYRYCKICKRYVARENKHCFKCNACTSKDGRPYKHCDICKRCVKESYVHCNNCNLCVLINHKCELIQRESSCHVCGDPGHKRKNCPKIESLKRKIQNKEVKEAKRIKKMKKCNVLS